MKSYLSFAAGIAATLLLVVGFKAFYQTAPLPNTASANISRNHVVSAKKNIAFVQEKRPSYGNAQPSAVAAAPSISSSYSVPLTSSNESVTTAAQDTSASAPQANYPSSTSSSTPSSTSSNEASSSSIVPTSDGGMEIIVGGSASIPAVLAAGAQEALLPNQTQKSPAAVKADQIAKDFVDDVTPDSDGQPVTPEQWDNAAFLADEKYRALKGAEAYMARSLEAAKEALNNGSH